MYAVEIEYEDSKKPKELWGEFNLAEVEEFMADNGFVQITLDDYRNWLNGKNGMSAVVRVLLKPE